MENERKKRIEENEKGRKSSGREDVRSGTTLKERRMKYSGLN